MNFFERIVGRFILKNAEPNEIEEVGVDDTDVVRDGVDLAEKVPYKVNRSIQNCRFASYDSQVKGILTDNITKSNNDFEITGDNAQAVKYIEERCKDWNISQLMDDMLWKGMVDGEFFINKWVDDNKINIRFLAFDADNYRIKRIYGENGEVLGFKQLTYRNHNTNKGWIAKKFEELQEELEELTVTLQKGEVINGRYLERGGKGHSIVMDVLEDVYYKRIMKDQLPTTVYKNSNIVQVIMGNETKTGKRLSEHNRKQVEEVISDYHKKGTLIFPFGVKAEVLKGGTLPDIPSYLKYIESCIFIGLNTPEAVFSSESSNRATADIQLDSPTTGRVLFLQYNQEWLKKIIEEELFKPELELNGYANATVEIEFNTDNLVNTPDSEDSEGNHKPINKKGEETGDNVSDNANDNNNADV